MLNKDMWQCSSSGPFKNGFTQKSKFLKPPPPCHTQSSFALNPFPSCHIPKSDEICAEHVPTLNSNFRSHDSWNMHVFYTKRTLYMDNYIKKLNNIVSLQLMQQFLSDCLNNIFWKEYHHSWRGPLVSKSHFFIVFFSNLIPLDKWHPFRMAP